MNTRSLGDVACLIILPETLDTDNETPYLEATRPQQSGQNRTIILDFSQVNYLNGLGASLLVKFQVLARQRKQRVIAYGVSDHYRLVFNVTGLDKAIPLYIGREAAFADAGIFGGQSSQPVKFAESRDAGYWAKPVRRLIVPAMPPEAANLNVQGRSVCGPVEGFGQLWQKRYRLHIENPQQTPEDIITIMKTEFPSLQPVYNRFYPSPAGIKPGEVVLIDSLTPGGPVSTGVIVLFADDRSFTFITPQGHPESGWVTFSAEDAGDGTVVQILGLARANDPVYEAAFAAVGSNLQIRIWRHVLVSLASHLRISPDITVEANRVDTRLQWSQIKNIWYNAQIRTLFHTPYRLLFRRNPKRSGR